MSPYDYLYAALTNHGAEVEIHQSDRDGNTGIFLVTIPDGTQFSIHFDKA